MRVEESYRLLDLEPGATDDEVKAAWRDLTKVWHPDRFEHDQDLRRKAQEKLKAINEAYESIRSQRTEAPAPTSGVSMSIRIPSSVVAIVSGFAAFLLLRRPTPGGLLIAGILLLMTVTLIVRALKASR
ncbi:MAG TPA: J domain-containing protein [Thermoanaerobaculia bacterium]|nr:J domain-containing protein [Thermoanaerobaculia bacterium]